MKALVAGWFSFEDMGATGGDIIVRDLACEWLRRAGRPYDIAVAAPFSGGVDWREVDPGAYSHVLFVCGPFGNGDPIPQFLHRFRNARMLGLNLTMLESLKTWNPFDHLIERDSPENSRPDLVFLSNVPKVPVVGLVLRDKGSEYGARHRYEQSIALIDELTASREMALVRIDTRLDQNTTGLRTPAEIESVIARTEVVVTTRLHGLVFALKNGVPAVVLDPIEGRGKLSRQAEVLGWPAILSIDEADAAALKNAFEFCLSEDARARARHCATGAVECLGPVREQFMRALSASATAAAT
jgi:hypothetical protein